MFANLRVGKCVFDRMQKYEPYKEKKNGSIRLHPKHERHHEENKNANYTKNRERTCISNT